MPSLSLLLLAGCICSTHSFSLTSIGSTRTAANTVSTTSSSDTSSSSRRSSLSVPFVFDKLRQQQHGGRAVFMAMTSTTSSGESSPPAAPASDGEALQSLFAKHCNEGLMAEDELRNVPAIKEMLEQGDLLSAELTEIWKAAPKFPQESTVVDKIDVDSFIQVYRDIDDLFDDDEASEDGGVVDEAAVTDDAAATIGEEDAELTQTFATLSNDDKPISFSQLRQWEEITSLIAEGALGEDELVTLWETSLGVKGTEGDTMDLQGFVKFNNALDDLFEFDEDEIASAVEDALAEEAEEAPAPPAAPRPIITEEDLPPGVLFSQLSNENYLVGMEDLSRWGELNDMLEEGDLKMDEFITLFDEATKAPGTKDMLDEDGFCALYDKIDSLFEEEEDAAEQQQREEKKELKEELLEFIEDIVKLAEEEGQLMCGLDCSDLEQERVLEVVTELERESYNKVVALSASGGGAIKKEELVGSWDLIYSSSSTIKYNEGLSGLAGGLTTFGGLQQELSSTKYMSDVEYTEQVVGKFGGQSGEVKITGDWDLRTEVSLFTGKPANILTVTPDRVRYLARKDKADHWKSLGPMNLLVLTYLDDDLRIMRGNTSTDTLFILRRSK